MMLLIEPGVTTGLNRLVIFNGPGPLDRLDDYVFRIPKTCYRVLLLGTSLVIVVGMEAKLKTAIIANDVLI